RHDRDATWLGLFGLLDMDFEDAVGVVRRRLAVARTLGQGNRARELSKGPLVAEEASVVDLRALTRAADRQSAVFEVDSDLLLRYSGEVKRIHELALGLPDVKRRCPCVARETGSAGRRL